MIEPVDGFTRREDLEAGHRRRRFQKFSIAAAVWESPKLIPDPIDFCFHSVFFGRAYVNVAWEEDVLYDFVSNLCR